MRNFKVGDEVVFKTWEEMVEEFGFNDKDYIECRFGFTSVMERDIYKNRVYTINSIENTEKVFFKEVYSRSGRAWSISFDMLKFAYEADGSSHKNIKIFNSLLSKDFTKFYNLISINRNVDELYKRLMTLVLCEKEMFSYNTYTQTISSMNKEDMKSVIDAFEKTDDSSSYFITCLESDISELEDVNDYELINLGNNDYILRNEKNILVIKGLSDNDVTIKAYAEVLCDALDVDEDFKTKLINGQIDELYEREDNKISILIDKKKREEFKNTLDNLKENLMNGEEEELKNNVKRFEIKVEHKMEEWKEAINSLNESKRNLFSYLYNKRDDKIEDFINVLSNDYENITYMSAGENSINISILQPLLFFDEEIWDEIRDSVLSTREEEKHVIDAVMSRKCTMILETGIRIELKTAELSYSYMENSKAFPNPHISEFNCWGDNRPIIYSNLINRDYDAAYIQIKSALGGINLEDTSVFPYFFDYFQSAVEYGRNDYECIIDNETGEVMTISEAEKYYREQEEKENEED